MEHLGIFQFPPFLAPLHSLPSNLSPTLPPPLTFIGRRHRCHRSLSGHSSPIDPESGSGVPVIRSESDLDFVTRGGQTGRADASAVLAHGPTACGETVEDFCGEERLDEWIDG